jgi:thiol oxidase
MGLSIVVLLIVWAGVLDAKPTFPLDMTTKDFNSTLEGLSQKHAVIEFYASWCPACRHFAPEYEKVGAFFSNYTPKAGAVFLGRVDCAVEVILIIIREGEETL